MVTFSVVIPTYNRKAQLIKVIEGLENQSFPKKDFEVIIISDGSIDGTNEYLKNLESDLNLKAVFQQNKGVAATRNNGVANATGKLILFIDDDVVPHQDLLLEHFKAHQKHGLKENVIVIGPMLNPPNHTCLLYTSPSPRDQRGSRMPSSA